MLVCRCPPRTRQLCAQPLRCKGKVRDATAAARVSRQQQLAEQVVVGRAAGGEPRRQRRERVDRPPQRGGVVPSPRRRLLRWRSPGDGLLGSRQQAAVGGTDARAWDQAPGGLAGQPEVSAAPLGAYSRCKDIDQRQHDALAAEATQMH